MNQAFIAVASIFASVAISLFPSSVNAQPFIEVGASGVYGADDFANQYTRGAFSAVFNLNTLPDEFDNGSPVYLGSNARILDRSMTTNGNVMGTSNVIDEDLWITENITAKLRVISDDHYWVTVSTPEGYFSELRINRTVGLTTDEDMTIQDDITQLFAFEASSSSSIRFNTGAGTIVWTKTQGFLNGAFRAWIKYAEEPKAAQCLVDLNNDGELDFFDIATFLTLFGNGCP